MLNVSQLCFFFLFLELLLFILQLVDNYQRGMTIQFLFYHECFCFVYTLIDMHEDHLTISWWSSSVNLFKWHMGKLWNPKHILTTPRFIEVTISSQNKLMFMYLCVKGISFRTVATVWYLLLRVSVLELLRQCDICC